MKLTKEKKEILLSALAHLIMENREREVKQDREKKLIEELFHEINNEIEEID